ELVLRLLALGLDRGCELLRDAHDLLDLVLVEPDAAAVAAAVDLDPVGGVRDVLNEHVRLALGAMPLAFLDGAAGLGAVPVRRVGLDPERGEHLARVEELTATLA